MNELTNLVHRAHLKRNRFILMQIIISLLKLGQECHTNSILHEFLFFVPKYFLTKIVRSESKNYETDACRTQLNVNMNYALEKGSSLIQE